MKSILQRAKGKLWLKVKNPILAEAAFIGKGKNFYCIFTYTAKDVTQKTHRPFQEFRIEKVVFSTTSLSGVELQKDNSNKNTWFGKRDVLRFKVVKDGKRIGYILLKKASKSEATSTLSKLYHYFTIRNEKSGRSRYFVAKSGNEIMVRSPSLYFTYYRGYLAYLYWQPLTIFNRYKLFDKATSMR